MWNKEFTLLRCSKCGKYFATKEQMEFINRKLDKKINMDMCENCRKEITAEKFRALYKNNL